MCRQSDPDMSFPQYDERRKGGGMCGGKKKTATGQATNGRAARLSGSLMMRESIEMAAPAAEKSLGGELGR